MPADEPWDSDDAMRELYGPAGSEIEAWDEASRYSRIRAMRIEGQTVAQIARSLNISVSTVKQSLTNQIKAESAAISSEEMGGILSMEMERLDYLVQNYWYAAQAGDIDSAKLLLAVGKERREWLKWADPKPDAAAGGMTNNILVIEGTEAEFLRGLERAREYLEGQGGQAATYEDAEVVADGDPEDT